MLYIIDDDRQVIAQLRALGLYRKLRKQIQARPKINHALIIPGNPPQVTAFLHFAETESKGWVSLTGDVSEILPLVGIALGSIDPDSIDPGGADRRSLH